jgi:hypothetical protein
MKTEGRVLIYVTETGQEISPLLLLLLLLCLWARPYLSFALFLRSGVIVLSVVSDFPVVITYNAIFIHIIIFSIISIVIPIPVVMPVSIVSFIPIVIAISSATLIAGSH